MERFTKLFGSPIVFVYHCFDRVVIHGYLSGLSRPEQVVYFFRQALGIPVVSKEVLRQRTDDYRNWVEAYARNHGIAMEWAEKGVRKEDHVLPALRHMNAWKRRMPMASTSSSRAWSSAAPSASACRSPRRTQCLNAHVDFPLLQRLALPINVGSVRVPGIKIQDTGADTFHELDGSVEGSHILCIYKSSGRM